MPVRIRHLLSPGKWIHAVRRRMFRWQAGRSVELSPAPGLELIGTQYARWYAPVSVMTPEWVVYAVGAGGDVSFELGLLDRTKCEVHTFDPAEESARYIESLADPRLIFHKYAIWTEDGELRMWRAADPTHMALSAANLQHTAESSFVQCRSIDSVMAEYGHRKVHIMKFTVDGAEYQVVDPEALKRWGVEVLNIAYLPSRPWRLAQRHIMRLIEAGYAPAARRDNTGICFITTELRQQLALAHPHHV